MLIAVGAITRRRPKMFGDLLDSFARMRRPDGARLIFVFAENDTEFGVTDQIEAFRAQVPEDVRLELEPRPGIPMGRNKVLDMALEAGADFLTFVDDDEVVTEDWLVELIAGVEARALDLAGAPVQLIAPEGAMTGWNEAVLKHLQYRSDRRNRDRRRMVADGTEGEMNIYTNNWCLRLATQRRLGVRFDEALQYTGGSDTRFSLDMKAAGGRIGWVPDAVVEEPTPQKRLTLTYHYKRARDQATNAVILNRKDPVRSVLQGVMRIVDAILLVIAFPVTGKYGIAKAAHKLGIAMGRFRGVFGATSSHYDPDASKFHTEKAK
ncbi:glycosyltransferase family 2 protein [Tropicimonas sp. IMCC34043]|uniref:glycosyltransferase family 2 protein n=1 Tax=Tropicimonas sp. IMCC34043 TaxID=2248760 RepID=UPI0018E541E6|nr:glycosyltransferase [Tropicimonas sp. IMCC34043]